MSEGWSPLGERTVIFKRRDARVALVDMCGWTRWVPQRRVGHWGRHGEAGFDLLRSHGPKLRARGGREGMRSGIRREEVVKGGRYGEIVHLLRAHRREGVDVCEGVCSMVRRIRAAAGERLGGEDEPGDAQRR